MNPNNSGSPVEELPLSDGAFPNDRGVVIAVGWTVGVVDCGVDSTTGVGVGNAAEGVMSSSVRSITNNLRIGSEGASVKVRTS